MPARPSAWKSRLSRTARNCRPCRRLSAASRLRRSSRTVGVVCCGARLAGQARGRCRSAARARRAGGRRRSSGRSSGRARARAACGSGGRLRRRPTGSPRPCRPPASAADRDRGRDGQLVCSCSAHAGAGKLTAVRQTGAVSAVPLLHERFPALRERLPHLALGERPTPVRLLEGLTAEGEAPVWVKDDGAFGSGAWGGNKVRKLEWLLPEARRRGARTILTVGGLGTNWGLAAALYGRDQGLRTALALVDQPVDEHVRRAARAAARARGRAPLHAHQGAARSPALPWLLLRTAAGGRRTCSRPAAPARSGVLGYVEAEPRAGRARWRRATLPEPSHVVVADRLGGQRGGPRPRAPAGRPAHARGGSAGHARPARRTRGSIARLAGSAGTLLSSRGAELPAAGASAGEPDRPRRLDRRWLRPSRRPRGRRPRSPRARATGSRSIRCTRPRRWRRCARENAAGRFGDGPGALPAHRRAAILTRL